ncbi:MAG: hypothetical protein L3J67_06045 [Hyphomicrobiaceae bacterium]|nr:hypothetical protein [Hyphomicrobiaceae bacterium]
MSDKVENKTNATLIGTRAQNETASYPDIDLMAQIENRTIHFTNKKGEPCK